MSPSRGTPTTPFRIDPALKARAQARATREGTTLTSVIIAALQAYAADEPDPTPTGDEPTEPTDMVTPLPLGTRVRITWPKSTHYGREGVIVSEIAGRYRVEINNHGGTFLRPHELEVIDAPDTQEEDS